MAVEDLQAKAAELAKKLLTVGVGAIFLTEESLRGLVSELKVPTEMLKGFFESANRSKREFLQGISQDIVARVMERIEPEALIRELLEKNKIHLKVEVSLSPKEKEK